MAGDEGEALVGIVRELGSELGCSTGENWGAFAVPVFGRHAGRTGAATLDPREEAFVGAMRLALAELAGAGGDEASEEQKRVVGTALDGAELVIRGQLAMGRLEGVTALLPSIVFLVALPILQQDEALAVSRRAAERIEQVLGA